MKTLSDRVEFANGWTKSDDYFSSPLNMAVEFHQQVPSFIKKNKWKICEWIWLVAYTHYHEIDQLAYFFCEPKELLKLNKQYLRHPFQTDILTFNYSTSSQIIAEVFINPVEVKSNAQFYDSSFSG